MSAVTNESQLVQREAEVLHRLFEEQADRRPSATALIYQDQELSYAQLDGRANQLARHLRDLGVGPGELVGVYLERSEKSVIAILAVLKAGAGYVPLDPAHPWERVRHILQEAKVSVLITETTVPDSLFDGAQVHLLQDQPEIARQEAERVSPDESGVSPGDLSYVLYTSGSTGRPKGVMTEHRNVVQFVRSFNETIQLTPADRVYQGFALGFDGSVEEMWMALSNGAALVVGPPEAARLGSEVARVFRQQGITVFSTVPTFLSLIQEDLPSVRLIIVSGEACPPEAVRRWVRPGRRMLNVYGPTETTVNTTAKDCVPGKPVTIGRPLRGYSTLILDEQQQPVPAGQPGELYIGGVGVARGYLNQPELTRKFFMPNPASENGAPQRVYRTGDLVQLDDEGELVFLGRIDRQVKIRGYRIELAEIESVLREHPQIQQAAVTVIRRGSLDELAAHVVTPGVNGSFDRDDVRQRLRNRLPHYMVPSYLDVIAEMPMLDSGKVDRRRLPEPATPLVSSSRTIVRPANEVEQKVADVWQDVCRTDSVSVEDDFFLDLGGYSLLAAQAVTALRNECQYDVAIRDLYEHPTVRQLAEHIAARSQTAAEAAAAAAADAAPQRTASREVFGQVPRLTRWACVALQALSLLLLYGLQGLPLLLMTWLALALIQGAISVSGLLAVVFAIVFFIPPLGILATIAVKWLVIGRYKPGQYPLWSSYYFRWWLVTRLQEQSWIELYAGTPIMSLYFRAMGAKVGRHCILDTNECVAFDLISIGDDTCIGGQTQLLGYRVVDGLLTLGEISIGDRCFVGAQCCLDINTHMEDDASLDDLSLLPAGQSLGRGESRRGSPARPAEVPVPAAHRQPQRRPRPFLWGMLFFLASEVVGELMLLSALPPLAIVYGCFLWGGLGGAVAGLFAAIPVAIVSFCLIVAGIKALILKRTKSGLYPVYSWYFLRKWCVDLLLSVAGSAMKLVYTTIYISPWLRLLGAKIGRLAEISTVGEMTPDLVTIEEGSFFADGSTVGGRRLYRGHVQLERNHIGRRSFVGNSALLPVGASLGNGCLLGVVSTPPGGVASSTPDGTEWLGSPAFPLPHRRQVEGFAESETYRPTIKLYLLRVLIDTLRILIPFVVGTASLVLFVAAAVAGFFYLPWWAVLALCPPVSLALAVGTALTVVVIKWAFMGTFEPVVKPLWCVYVWSNELVNGAYETLASPVLETMQGTPFICWYLRLLGCRIGKHVFLETTLFSEFDLVEIGDYAALNLGVVVQNHLFEDRIMKSSRLKIGADCSVGNMSVVLYDTEMRPGSSMGPLSLLMKGETLAPESRCQGIPNSPVT